MRTPYVATENLIPGGGAYIFRQQVEHYKAYGPPPPNYWQTRRDRSEAKRYKMVYADHSVHNNIKTSKDGESEFHHAPQRASEVIHPRAFSQRSSAVAGEPVNFSIH
jgi:hypothetical protein